MFNVFLLFPKNAPQMSQNALISNINFHIFWAGLYEIGPKKNAKAAIPNCSVFDPPAYTQITKCLNFVLLHTLLSLFTFFLFFLFYLSVIL